MIVDYYRIPLPTVFLATMRTALTVSVLLHLCFVFCFLFFGVRVYACKCVRICAPMHVRVGVLAKPLVV